jgi:hypothetical protein
MDEKFLMLLDDAERKAEAALVAIIAARDLAHAIGSSPSRLEGAKALARLARASLADSERHARLAWQGLVQ